MEINYILSFNKGVTDLYSLKNIIQKQNKIWNKWTCRHCVKSVLPNNSKLVQPYSIELYIDITLKQISFFYLKDEMDQLTLECRSSFSVYTAWEINIQFICWCITSNELTDVLNSLTTAQNMSVLTCKCIQVQVANLMLSKSKKVKNTVP